MFSASQASGCSSTHKIRHYKSKLKCQMKCTFQKFLKTSNDESSANSLSCSPLTPLTPSIPLDQAFLSSNNVSSSFVQGCHPTDSVSFYNHRTSHHSVFNLPKRVETLSKADGYADEFNSLRQFDQQLTRASGMFVTARKNPSKNRFSNVLPNEDTLVKLSSSEYINANLIHGKGFGVCQSYIACQAPLPESFSQFWEMAFEQNCKVIVMLANELHSSKKGRLSLWNSVVESDSDPFSLFTQKRKVHVYYPELHQKCIYGNIIVENVKETCHKKDHIVIRDLVVMRDECRRTIRLYQFTGWPDMGIPKVKPFFSLLNQIDEELELQPDMGPIIIHCIAGVGRTGTFAAVHIALTQMKNHMENRSISDDTEGSDQDHRMTSDSDQDHHMKYERHQDVARHIYDPSRRFSFSSDDRMCPSSPNDRRMEEDSDDLMDSQSSSQDSVQNSRLSHNLFDIYGIVMNLKKARVGMVQKCEQYRFIYEAVLDAAKRKGFDFTIS